MPKETIMSKISDEEFAYIVSTSSSLKEIGMKCGYSCNSGASSSIVKNRINKQGLSFQGTRANPVYREDKDIFIADSPVDQSTLRKRYLQGNFSEYKCSICGQEPIWNGKELVLTLDHINGHNHDDRLENLRWVCPNCDRQLSTFAGRNIVYEKNKNYCIDCGKEILQSSIRCPDCAAKTNGLKHRLAERPERNELKTLIRVMPFVKIGEKYGVSDNAIRKWCDAYGLPRVKKEIMRYSDEEWNNL